MLSSYNRSSHKIENFLIDKGYPDINRGLVVFGGENNGTVDLKASKKDMSKSIIIEIKNNPIHVIDLSRFLSIKRNIESHSRREHEKLVFYLLTVEKDISNSLKQLAKEKDIIVLNIDNFLDKKDI